MKSNTTQARDRKEADKQRIINLLKEKDGVLSAEIATKLQITPKYVRTLLIAMRNNKLISCKRIAEKSRVHLWSLYKDTPLPTKECPLYPDFDKEHEEWRKQVLSKKPRYNPHGKQ